MNRLKELREEMKWTQKYLGSILKLKNSAISKYETGRSALTEETIVKLAGLFHVSTDYLLGVSDNKRSNDSDLDNGKAINNPLFTKEAGEYILPNNSISKDDANVLNYFHRLNDENKDFIKGQMVGLYKEQTPDHS